MTRHSTKYLLILAVAASSLRGSDAAAQIVYTFRSFSVCGNCLAGTGGINDEGLVGVSASSSGNPLQAQGYLYNSRSDTAVAVPGSLGMDVPSDNGTAPGLTSGPPPLRPFIRQRDGTVQILDGFPGALLTNILQFNGRGASVGYASLDFVSFFSFERSRDGSYSKIVYPGPVGNLTLGTFLLGWNEAGTMVGYLADPTETQTAGLIRHCDGMWERFMVPGSTSTMIFAINESGTLAGGYRDNTRWHGFVWRHGHLQTVDVPGAANTVITGINSEGELAGMTFTAPSPLLGLGTTFVASPARQ
jgi:hypothetical protein